MAWVDPPTFVDGAVLTAAQLNQYITANSNYLKAIADGLATSGVHLRRAATQSIATSTDTLVSFDTEVSDYGGWWSSGTTVTTPAGAIPSGSTTVRLLVVCAAKFDTNATGKREVAVLKNGSQIDFWKVTALDDDTTSVYLTTESTTASTDTWTLQVWQNSGGALNIIEARLILIRLGPAT